jgi:hypothetical protein
LHAGFSFSASVMPLPLSLTSHHNHTQDFSWLGVGWVVAGNAQKHAPLLHGRVMALLTVNSLIEHAL